ncbi:MAG: hypothetical protein MUF29_03835 [Chitinophagaceae bacterium]|nr:hypothetical protein [Chitinophagaceae bacterium]
MKRLAFILPFIAMILAGCEKYVAVAPLPVEDRLQHGVWFLTKVGVDADLNGILDGNEVAIAINKYYTNREDPAMQLVVRSMVDDTYKFLSNGTLEINENGTIANGEMPDDIFLPLPMNGGQTLYAWSLNAEKTQLTLTMAEAGIEMTMQIIELTDMQMRLAFTEEGVNNLMIFEQSPFKESWDE